MIRFTSEEGVVVGNKSRVRRSRTAAAALVAAVVVLASAAFSNGPSPSSNTDEDAAVNAYVYTYPLVSVEVTRRQSTNVARPDGRGAAPMNQFANLAFMPDASCTSVVRPNVDTLYSSMFFDVSKEPLVIGVPDMGTRYHLFPLLDMWTNVDASPGPRTLGVLHGYQFAITGPNWHGTLPAGVREYRMPTDGGWIIGRIQVNGPNDVPAVAAIQQQLTAVPLSAYGTPYVPPENTDLHADWPKNQEVAAYIHNLTPQQYWDLYYDSLSHAQTRPEDKDLLTQLAKVRWSPDKKLDWSQLSDSDRKMWENAWTKALPKIEVPSGGTAVNGWRISRSGIGSYGTNWLARANVAYAGLGANLPDDAVYPATSVDGKGDPLEADHNYLLHFGMHEIPPVHAFWSLTMYNDKGFFVHNPAKRYARRGESVQKNPDGSVDIYIQPHSPGAEREVNWLPAPASGNFNLLLRLYSPDTKVLDGRWNPPGITKIS